MDVLAASLRYWIAYKLNTDPAWAKMKVIISDSTVPGEGEHKIMEFVRSQRSSPDHNPNTRHVMYGLDADLIMLGLATHEPHFRILREDVFFNDGKPRTCKLCGQAGHEARSMVMLTLKRAQFILDGLAKQEDAIFRKRRKTEENFQKKRKLNNERNERYARGRGSYGGAQESPSNGRRPPSDVAPSGLPLFTPGAAYKANVANKSAAAAIKEMMNGKSADDDNKLIEDDDSSAPGRIRPPLGHQERQQHLAMTYLLTLSDYGKMVTLIDTMSRSSIATLKDIEFRHQVGRAYVEGLAWVLLYYFQGCPSWDWYYPYHYAPFAADFANLKDMKISFQKGRIFRPFEQLMGVLPAASRQAIPEQFHHLMTNEDSEIIDFYPEDFIVDLNGKKFAWQGVALLPFI
ncbi:hypothetical protein DID88_007985 [Monilinia fructigena]|uniref:Xrn1 N-terminal domain-containing protein n=1 Tax=Monilinia fructigena TaxID=38457 RepID=A0A395J921_9HELO|nr:hypothetical protein DID88_007985 [Monilinia fructigena]